MDQVSRKLRSWIPMGRASLQGSLQSSATKNHATGSRMIKLITVRDGADGPVVYMWVDGKEVGHVELTTRATANLIADLAKRIVEKPNAEI